jgi:hypothetical protein
VILFECHLQLRESVWTASACTHRTADTCWTKRCAAPSQGVFWKRLSIKSSPAASHRSPQALSHTTVRLLYFQPSLRFAVLFERRAQLGNELGQHELEAPRGRTRVAATRTSLVRARRYVRPHRTPFQVRLARRKHRVVALQVAFERRILKPVFRTIGVRLWV